MAWLLIVACTVCWGCLTVTNKLAIRHMSPVMFQMVSFYVFSAFAPVLWLYLKVTNAPTTFTMPGVFWATVTCLLATVAGLAFSFSIQKVPVHTVVGLCAVNPVITFALCYVFLGEPVTTRKMLGIVVIVLGTILLGL